MTGATNWKWQANQHPPTNNLLPISYALYLENIQNQTIQQIREWTKKHDCWDLQQFDLSFWGTKIRFGGMNSSAPSRTRGIEQKLNTATASMIWLHWRIAVTWCRVALLLLLLLLLLLRSDRLRERPIRPLLKCKDSSVSVLLLLYCCCCCRRRSRRCYCCCCCWLLIDSIVLTMSKIDQSHATDRYVSWAVVCLRCDFQPHEMRPLVSGRDPELRNERQQLGDY